RHRGRLEAFKAPVCCWHRKSILSKTNQLPFAGHHPQMSLRIVTHLPGIIERRPFAGYFIGSKPAIPKTQEFPLLTRYPQRSPMVHEELNNSIIFDRRSIILIEHLESHTIKPHQSILCPQPEITVGCLNNRCDRALWQPLVRLPD